MTKNTIKISTLYDNDLFYDQITFNNYCEESLPEISNRRNTVKTKPVKNFKISDIEYEDQESVSISVFSVQWPYVVFAGLKPNCIFIINAFDTNLIHRVHLVDNKTCLDYSFKILYTTITFRHDILIMTKLDTTYRIYIIQMKNNIINDTDKFDSKTFFNPKILFEYDELDVEDKDFDFLYARGSSKGDRIDTN